MVRVVIGLGSGVNVKLADELTVMVADVVVDDPV